MLTVGWRVIVSFFARHAQIQSRTMRSLKRTPSLPGLRLAVAAVVFALLWWSAPANIIAQQSGYVLSQQLDDLKTAFSLSDGADSAFGFSGDIYEQSTREDRAVLISMREAEIELSWTRTPEQVIYRPDPYRFWKWPAKDALALGKGLASDASIMALGGGAILLLAARHDREITADLSDLNHEPAELLVRVVEEFGNVRSVRPFAGFVFLGTLMTDNDRLQDAAFTSFEAVIMSNLVTSGLKTLFGRARPFQNEGDLDFKPFSGNTSFPSGHATTAFAFITPWLLYYPTALTPGLLVLGAGTAFTRMLTHNHWFTDVVAGSAIGFATAYVLSRRHQDERSRIQVAPSVNLDQVGLTVAVKMP